MATLASGAPQFWALWGDEGAPVRQRKGIQCQEEHTISVTLLTARRQRAGHAEDRLRASKCPQGERALAMHMCRSVGAFLIIAAFVVTLAFAAVVMTIRAVDLLQQPLTGIDDGLYAESLDECDPFTFSVCF
jgi:hypothetical protein